MSRTLDKTSNNPDRITSLYAPELKLAEFLDQFAEEAEITYNSQNENPLIDRRKVSQVKYTMTYEGFELQGTETYSPFGVMVSLEGNLGFASSAILAEAVILGKTTQIYTDEALPNQPSIDNYQDLTAEWYRDFAVEENFPELRFQARPSGFKPEKIPTSTIEEWAEHWLSLD